MTPMPRRSLYTITADLAALDTLLDECEGDISDPRAEEAIETWAKELAQDEGIKLDGLVSYLKQLDMERTACTEQMREWAARCQVRANRIQRLRQLVVDHLVVTGRTKLQLPSGIKLAVQKNGGKTPIQIDDIDPSEVAEVFQVETISINRDRVREFLEAGERLPFARLVERGVHLRVI